MVLVTGLGRSWTPDEDCPALEGEDVCGTPRPCPVHMPHQYEALVRTSDDARSEPVDGRCVATRNRCFPFGCSGPVGCRCTCHAVPDDASSQAPGS